MAPTFAPPEIRRRAITVQEFFRMAETGILQPDERIELIEGEMVQKMSPIGRRHHWIVTLLDRILRIQLGGKYPVSIQGPLHLGETTYVEPDIVIAKEFPASLSAPSPGPRDVLLLIEVADSSLAYDRDVKLPLYARAGIGEVWIVDAAAQTLTVHRDPSPKGYSTSAVFNRESKVTALAIPELELDLTQVFR